MLSNIAFGVPRSSMTNERRSSSIRRNSLPKFALVLGTDTAAVAIPALRTDQNRDFREKQ
jgi:hypothetical protein